MDIVIKYDKNTYKIGSQNSAHKFYRYLFKLDSIFPYLLDTRTKITEI
jgi:hypothetical protein